MVPFIIKNKLLHAAGIDRELVFMTNLVKCMLPKNRKPSLNEIEEVKHYYQEVIHAREGIEF